MAYPLSRRIVWPLLRWRITSISGLENIPLTGPALLVANHVGDQDPLLLGTAAIIHTNGRTVHTIAKWKIFQCPIWKNWMGIIPLLPDRARTFQLAKDQLKRDELVMIFPEGGVNIKPTIEKIKSGAARLAVETKVPVIPIGLRRLTPPPITDLGYVLEIFYAKLHIAIGQPIDLSPWYDKPIDQPLIQAVNHAIISRVAALAGKTYQPSH